MKSKLQAVSLMLLVALVLSLVPAAALPSSASAAQTCTDRAQFIADVTVPDGTRFDPGATFTKTWRLRNIGTCTWTTAYTMVFNSGEQMGSTTPVPMPSNVAPGQNVDVSVNLTAPNAAGHYLGYWRFKNASGAIFGIGLYANKSWWVEINVTGSTQTGVAYDFTANAGSATWSSGAGGLSFPSTNGDPKGFALRYDRPSFESGVTASQPGMLFSPQQITNGFIQAVYPDFAVQRGDRFQTTVGCEFNAKSCYVAYRLDYQVGNTIRNFWSFREKYEGWTYSPNLDLSPLAGQTVKFILYVSAYGSPVGDFALWGNPVIVRQGVTTTPTPTMTGTPPTPTPTSTPGPVTGTVPPSSCDRVEFVRDMTIPDGTLMAPGASFTKTWRLKNIGACAWNSSYQLVFFSGQQMGGPSSAPLPLSQGQVISTGQTIDISVNLTAPSNAGSYRGYWMFKNATGALFGFGPQGNKAWWVDIRVSGPTATPGPTFTPGPSVTPSAGIAYDFATRACDDGKWFSGAGQIACPGTEGDAKGFVFEVSNPRLETGATDSRPSILAFPQNSNEGYIQGFFPAFRVQRGDRFRSSLSCEYGATACYALFSLDYQTGTDPIRSIKDQLPFLEKYDQRYGTVDVDLSFLAGKDVKFILTVRAWGAAVGDRALWVGPHIYRQGGGGTAQPDLTISQMKVEFQNNSCLLPGDTLGLRVSVTNSGQAAAGTFNVKFNDAQQTVNGLAVGETKTVFFSGYSNQTGASVTVTVDPNNAIAESNEQNNTRTEQVPVPTAPLPCTATPTSTPGATTTATPTATSTTSAPTSGPTATPTPTSTSAAPTATPTSTSTSAAPTPTPTPTSTSSTTTGLYQNNKYNFRFSLPSGANIVSQSDTVGLVTLPIVTAGTNLLSKYIQIHVVEGTTPCVSPVMDNPTSSENVSINNIQFLKQKGQGAAVGNRYDWTAYSTTYNNACISLAFVLHSADPGVFATKPPGFDMVKESEVIGTTMSTYSKIN
jgi:hypothetical protein